MTLESTRAGRPWWHAGVLYQVYPRSFQDTDGDGVGDLAGIAARLDHLSRLGVDAVWISPIFRSPMRDFGYDISDYRDVDPVFGTLEDLDRLVAEAHARGIRVLLDYVPNHTSSDHPWFRGARSSRESPRRDWYIWRDPAPGGGPPNELGSIFGGSAWELDEATGQYWLHTFLPEQPDLDWRNPAVRAAMLDVLRFWFDRGIDGFRIDVLWLLAKDEAIWAPPDGRPIELDPVRPGVRRHLAIDHGDGPGIGTILAELRAVADEHEGRVLIGELYMPFERLVRYYGTDGPGIHLPFNFSLILAPWKSRTIARLVAEYEAALPPDAWPNWVLGNHDQPRVASRVGRAQARVAAMLLLTLRGTPTLYYGDEIGMCGVDIPPDRVVDVAGRDPERTPMRWDGGPNAGFTTGTPWLPIGEDVEGIDVAAQADEPRSMLTLHRRLIALRRAEAALAIGDWAAHPAPDGTLLYERRLGERRLLVVLGLTSAPVTVDMPLSGRWRVLLSTGLDRDGERVEGRVTLGGDEGLVLEPAP